MQLRPAARLGLYFLLALSPLLWASNAVVGRMVSTAIPALTFNFVRWVTGLLILLPLTFTVFRRGSPYWAQWKRYAVLGALGMGGYSSLQYTALKTSSAINVTLVAASMPIWILLIGVLFFGQRITMRQVMGLVLSLAGVVLVLSRGQLDTLLTLRLVTGDFYAVAAAMGWALYSWLLTNNRDHNDPMRSHWTWFLAAQMLPSIIMSGALAGGDWALHSDSLRLDWSWTLVIAIVYVAVGPGLIAYKIWDVGLRRVGPASAGFIANLAPVFAALLSAIFLGEGPELFHALAFALIVGGIVVSARKAD